MKNNIDSSDWFDVLNMPKKLSSMEKMWLRTGYEYQFVSRSRDYTKLKNNLEDYFLINEGVKPKDLRSGSRFTSTLEPRQMIMHCLKLHTGAAYKKIGNDYSRDHATAIHAMKKVENLIETEPLFRMRYQDMLKWVSLNSEADKITKRYA